MPKKNQNSVTTEYTLPRIKPSLSQINLVFHNLREQGSGTIVMQVANAEILFLPGGILQRRAVGVGIPLGKYPLSA